MRGGGGDGFADVCGTGSGALCLGASVRGAGLHLVWLVAVWGVRADLRARIWSQEGGGEACGACGALPSGMGGAGVRALERERREREDGAAG